MIFFFYKCTQCNMDFGLQFLFLYSSKYFTQIILFYNSLNTTALILCVLSRNFMYLSIVHWLADLMLKYVGVQVDFQAGVPLRQVSQSYQLRSLPYQDCERNISTQMNANLIHLRHYLNKRSRAFPVCN